MAKKSENEKKLNKIVNKVVKGLKKDYPGIESAREDIRKDIGEVLDLLDKSDDSEKPVPFGLENLKPDINKGTMFFTQAMTATSTHDTA